MLMTHADDMVILIIEMIISRYWIVALDYV